jgi:hypothetical protein
VPIPEHLLAEEAQALAGAQSGAEAEAMAGHVRPGSPPSVPWTSLWRYLVHELGVAAHLRLALDDPHLPVAAAAAGALEALLGGGPEEAIAWEVADSCPALGHPSAWAAPLTRAHPSATWEAQSPVPAPPQGSRGGSGGDGGAGEEDEEAPTPEDVAVLDPVAGLLQMGLAGRARWLLGEGGMARTHPRGAAHLLRALSACVRHSEAAAQEVAR